MKNTKMLEARSKKLEIRGLVILISCLLLFTSNLNAQFKHTILDSVKAGTTSSAAIDMEGFIPVGIVFPATFTGATVTIKTSQDTTSANFKTLQYDGADVTLTASDGKYCQFKPVEAWGILRYIKIVSASTEAATRNIKIYGTR